jgi:homoserine O-succinyltransferase
MPIRIPDTLPAFETLVHEGVRVMTETMAVRQDIRPLQIGLLNLMPNKIKTEVQFARLIGASPLQVELTLVRVGGHKAKNTPEEHLLSFYQTWDEVKDRKFDGFIITGAPVETLPFEEVTYWPELEEILDWTETNVHSTMNVCWGGMAAIYHFHKVPKHALKEKAFGVYRHRNLAPSSVYLQKPPTSHLQDTTCQRLSSSLLSLSLKDTLTSFATKFLTLSWMLALLPTPTPKLLAKPPARLVW